MSLLENVHKKATVKNARDMIIFSYPKVGKTRLVSQLPGNYLTLDFEGGTDYYDMNAIDIKHIDTLATLMDEFRNGNHFYDFIVLDTITSLYDGLVNQLAIMDYNKDENKKKPLDWDITLLPYGIGYSYKRNVLQKLKDFFKQYCNCLISLGHVADKAITGNSENVSVKDLDVEGKLRNILALKTDAMGLLYRSGKNKNSLSFNSEVGMIGGTRIPHLANQTFIISEIDENNNFITHWDKVFI